ncbi:MAG: hypothetical protein JRH20_31220 [Deltaproteobacteria bacterium]|nr:hypothetical protein [Deltaproteobacteria bacterium]
MSAPRFLWTLIGLALVLSVSACRVRPSARLGHQAPHVSGIRIVEAKAAEQRGLHGERFDFPFGDNQDGTKLVIDYLAAARNKGASYVSDLRIVLAQPTRRCETRLLPLVHTQTYLVPKQIPARTVRKQVRRPVTRTVTEQKYECRSVSRPVTRYETRYESSYDYSSKSMRSRPVSRSVTRYESKSECRYRPVTRTVTRYEVQYETRYIPPRLVYLKGRYTDFDMVESRPICREVKASTATGRSRHPHRITGIIYRSKRDKPTKEQR